MTEEEYLELLAFIRAQLREIGRADIDAMAHSVSERHEQPSQIAFAFLDSVWHQFALESREGVQSAVSALRESIQSEEPISDIQIIPTEGGDAFRRLPVSLSEALPDRSDLLQDLRVFALELREEYGRPPRE